MWIPKDLLRAQGYYDGQTKIWVPRTHKPKPQQPKQASTEYRWIPKSTLKAQGYYEGQEYLWLLKGKPILRQAQRTQQKPISQPEIAVNKATTTSKQDLVKQVWLPKKQPPTSPTIKHRAQLLQQVFLHQLPQAAVVRIITALQLKTQDCA